MTPGREAYEADRIEAVSLEWDELGPETRAAYEREARRYGRAWKATDKKPEQARRSA